ncbi:MAG TPA: V4R domain-containing protein [archaeon]|nr:V4R domain-containing protein [archaeon]
MAIKNNRTIIFSTKDGMVALDGPVKLKILKFIGNKCRPFEDIVKETCKAKSTISVHLKDLLEQNIILEQRDCTDKRKKYYVLNSQFIAYSDTPTQKSYDVILDRLINSVDSEYEFFKTLCHTIRYGLEAYGMNPKPVMKRIGDDIGTKMAELFVSDNLDDLILEMAKFWEMHNLGKVEIYDPNPLTLLIHDCFDCSDMPDVGRTLCSLDEGLIEGILLHRLNLNTLVEEVECYGTGFDHCKMIIHFLD